MNSYFVIGYISNIFCYHLWGLMVLFLGIGYERLPLKWLISFAFFYLFSVLLFSIGYKKGFLSKGLYIRFQDIAFIVANIFLAIEVQSIQFFLYGMILSTVLIFMFVSEAISKFNCFMSIPVIVIVSLMFRKYMDENLVTTEYILES